MGKIVITQFVTVDGVIEDPGGVEGFKYGGWTFDVDESDEMVQFRGDDGNEFKIEETRRSAALLLGRKTYEAFAEAWPAQSGEFADMFNSMPKYVVSSTLTDPEWNNSKVLDGDVPEAIERLTREVDGEIVVHGSIQLTRALLEHDLVDELRLMVYPFVLGAGERLFGEMTDRRSLQLTESTVVGAGVVILTYARAVRDGEGSKAAAAAAAGA